MDNPARTAEHRERLAQRRETLQAAFERILPPGRTAFVWEAGCGHGHFLTAYAQAHPERICVGVDLVWERIARANRKRDRAQLANLHFLQAEARMFLEELPDRATLSAVYVLFSDPWPKQRHHKHRLLQPDFLTAVAARAEEGARLYFRTDYEPYFLEAEATVRAHEAWRLSDEAWPFETITVFQQRASSHRSLIAIRA